MQLANKLQFRRLIYLFSLVLIFVFSSVGAQQQERIFEIAISGDGQVIAITYGTRIVDLINSSSGNQIHTANLPDFPRRLELNPTGDQFLWSDNIGNIHLYDVTSSTNTIIRQGGAILAGPMTWHPTNGGITITRGQIASVSMLVGNAISAPSEGSTYVVREDAGAIVDLAWSPDGQLLATSHFARNALDPTFDNAEIQIWDVELGDVLNTPQVRYDDRAGGPIAWSPDGTQLALLGNELVIYDLSTDRFVQELALNVEELPITLAWSPTGNYIATGGTMIRIWDTDIWEVVGTLPADANRYVSAIQWSPDGQTIYSNRTATGLSIDPNPALTDIQDDE